MNIDLVYYFREVNHNYFLNGPEKVNGNIVNNSPAYQLSTASDVITKINQMIASLAPDVTNLGLVSSELYTGNIQVNTYSGELNISSAPDYTSILTSINTNLTNLNSKFEFNEISITALIRGLFNSLNGGSVSGSATDQKNNSFIRNAFFYNGNTVPAYGIVKILDSSLNSIYNMLRQSGSPNASITDVISALNTNIHNDLTNINTTTENKDTVLLIDGQQEFKLRNKEEMEF